MVALALLGGTGLIVYAAALVLVPSDGEVERRAQRHARPRDRRRPRDPPDDRRLLVRPLRARLRPRRRDLPDRASSCVAGLAVWWLVSGERPSGSAGDVARRAALGVALLFGCFALAVGSFLAERLRRRRRRRRRSSSPPARRSSARRSSAARAGSSCRRWRSRCRSRSCRRRASTSTAASASGTCVPARSPRSRTATGSAPASSSSTCATSSCRRAIVALKIDIGAGHALVLVDDDVCVASTASIGMGAVSVFERDNGGIDVDWERRAARARRHAAARRRRRRRARAARGAPPRGHDPRRRARRLDPDRLDERNDACITRTASSGARRLGPIRMSLVAGIVLVVLGIVLLLDSAGVLHLTFGDHGSHRVRRGGSHPAGERALARSVMMIRHGDDLASTRGARRIATCAATRRTG